MKNCILFITKHGSTEKAALLLKEKIQCRNRYHKPKKCEKTRYF